MFGKIANAITNLNLTIKLPLTIALSALISCIAVGILSYQVAKKEISQVTSDGLAAILDARAAALTSWFDTIRQDLVAQSENPATFSALQAFSTGWQGLRNPGDTLRRLYIEDNPYDLGEKDLLDYASDGSGYSAAHKIYHPPFRTFLKQRGYYDIFLFDTDGTLVYSVFKENDFATNVNDGQWKDTDLGNAFRAALAGEEKDRTHFFDFKPYAPSNDAPASFISAPLIDADGSIVGVLIFQMPIDSLNAVMQDSSGMGETGETYAVGPDGLMRTDSLHIEGESTILKQRVDLPEVQAAFDGRAGTDTGRSILGHQALIAFKSINLGGTTWALIAEKSLEETEAAVASLGQMLLFGTLIILALVIAAGLTFSRSIVGPITRLVNATRLLAEGNKSTEIPGLVRTDEIGNMANAIQVFKEASIKMEEMAEQQFETEKRATTEREQAETRQRTLEEETRKREEASKEASARQRKEEMNNLASRFEQSVMNIVSGVTAAAEELNNTSSSMQNLIQSTDEKIKQVAGQTEEANSAVQAISAAADELSASIENIGQQAQKSSATSDIAKKKADVTNTTVSGLSEAATRIGDVIGLIKDIAEQTNLLALNATIESARAGEAGKGFAVVASEVKNLATQTGRATEDIASQIESIQSVTNKAAEDISEIVTIINDLNVVAEEISNVTNEQSQATIEITQSIGRTADSTNQVATDIQGVMQHVGETRRSADEVQDASSELARQSATLQQEISDFLQEVRTG